MVTDNRTVHDHVSFDGEIVLAAEPGIAAVSAAALYGRGVFTTIAIRSGELFLWQKHWKRLQNDAATIGMDLSGVIDNYTQHALIDLIVKNSVETGRARITLFDESPTATWPFEHPRKTRVLITTADPRPVPDAFRIELSSASVSSLSRTAGIKSCNYLDTLLAYEETRHFGFDEAIRLNERGEIVSACMANVFWLKDRQLFTPDLKTGCIPGTTREFVLENVECKHMCAGFDAINTADAIFLTSAGLGIVPVAELGGREFVQVDHPIIHIGA